MAIDMRLLEASVSRRKGFMSKLGDVGRFLTGFIRGGDTSEEAIKTTIGELRHYSSTCLDQMDELGEEKLRTYREIADLKQRMADAPPPKRSSMLANGAVLLRRHDGFQSGIDRLKHNAIRAEVLIQKLLDLLFLRQGPMTENDMDEWTSTLEESIEERAMAERAFLELEKTSERMKLPAEEEVTAEETEAELKQVADQESRSREERAIEKRLEEF
jgi:hypothetical protein